MNEDRSEIVSPKPVIKTSNNSMHQALVDDELTRMEDESPSSDFYKTNLELIGANKQARNMVATQLHAKRIKDREHRIKEKLQTTTEAATRDMLTGLLNRRGFDERLAEITSANAQTTIVILDANNLKYINDTRGHQEGDKLIKGIADVLTETSTEGCVIARTGGDEFMVLLPTIAAEEIKEWWKTNNQIFLDRNIQISAGSTRLDSNYVEKSIEKADRNMYEAKRKSKALKENVFNQE